MNTKVAVLVIGAQAIPGAWADQGRVTSLMEAIFAEFGAEVTCYFGQAVKGSLSIPGLLAAVYIPADTFPLPSMLETFLENRDICTWKSDTGAFAAVGLGESALVALNSCSHLSPRIIARQPELLAQHLAADHGVPVVRWEQGLVDVRDSAQRSRALLVGKDVTLRRLAPLLGDVVVDGGLSFDWSTWSSEPDLASDSVVRFSGGNAIIIRSCAGGEDGWQHSHAGAFASVVVGPNAAAADIAGAIGSVFRSYSCVRQGDRVFVQRWVDPVEAAGIVTSRTLAGAPYYIVAIDEVSGRTDQVTGGFTDNVNTQYVHRMLWSELSHAGEGGLSVLPELCQRFLSVSSQVEHVVGSESLDLELALAGGTVHLLQVRPLATFRGSGADTRRSHSLVRQGIVQLHKLARHRDDRVHGDGLLLSNMTDWNPAEMIGRSPSPLAISLYKTLITDNTWALQRAECGYRDLRGVPLMHIVAGSPYIDVMASLTSFLPATFSDEDGREILHAQCSLLRSEPAMHDKVEFGIAATCWTPDLENRLAHLGDWGVSGGVLGRLQAELVALTRGIAAGVDRHLAALSAYELPTNQSALEHNLDDTLDVTWRLARVFAHLARAAFVAVDMLRALEELGLIEEREAWMRGAGTVVTELQQDAAAVADGTMPWLSFVERHRWTRPGTYDPTVPNYGQDVDGYLRPLVDRHLHGDVSSTAPSPPSPLRACDVRAVDVALAPVGLDTVRAEVFFRKAIRGREAAKAMYASWVSVLLESVVARGGRYGFDRSDVAQLTVPEIRGDWTKWAPMIDARRDDARDRMTLLEMPDVITMPDDLLSFVRRPGKPNFVGSGAVTGLVHVNPTATRPPPPGAVVVVESADPGYDWVFSLGIAALVTAYGGANSHMAIRCAELGLPAAIGVGPQQFEFCRAGRLIRLDTSTCRLIVSP